MTPEFIRALASSGYAKLSLKELVQCRIHGIDSDFMRSISGGKGGSDARKKP